MGRTVDGGEGGVVLRGLTKRFGDVEAIRNIDLEIKKGEFLTLLGPSGSGKTTILRILAGFEEPTNGRVLLDGRDIARMPPNKRNVGMVFQNYALFPHMSVADNIVYPLKRRRWSLEMRNARLDEVIQLLRLDGLSERRPHQLSGGQQQRVALGRALAFRPPLLLMDEPLGALDRALRLEMQDEIRRVHREVGTTVLYVTHDREESLTMSTRIALLRSGNLEQVGAPKELFENPTSEFVARFLGDCNVWPLQEFRVLVDKVGVSIGGRQVAVRLGDGVSATDEMCLLLRPSQIDVVDGRMDVGSDDIVLAGAISDVMYIGETTRLNFVTEELGTVMAFVKSQEIGSLREGDEVRTRFAAADLLCVPAGERLDGERRKRL